MRTHVLRVELFLSRCPCLTPVAVDGVVVVVVFVDTVRRRRLATDAAGMTAAYVYEICVPPFAN